MNAAPLHRLPLPGGPLAYRLAGEGPPLILVHGWRCSSRHWQGARGALAAGRRLYAIDLPGHGETPPWPARLSISALARLVLDFADALGLDRFDLVGHSFGGAVAVEVAGATDPARAGRVRRLVLSSLGMGRTELERVFLREAHAHLNLALGWWRPWLAQTRALGGLMGGAMAGTWPPPWMDWAGVQPALNRAFAGAFMRHLPADPDLIAEGVREFLGTDPLSALEMAADLGSPAFIQALGRVSAPVLVVSGASDPIMPVAGVQALADGLADHRLVLLEDCGHLPMIERPGEFHRLLDEFLTA